MLSEKEVSYLALSAGETLSSKSAGQQPRICKWFINLFNAPTYPFSFIKTNPMASAYFFIVTKS
jgi:hypothetical protein